MGKKFANLLGVLCAYALFALFGISAAADSGVINVPYWDPVTEKTQYTDATEIRQGENFYHWTSGWYVAEESVTINQRVEIIGDVSLILSDYSQVYIPNGIHVGPNSSLSIYAQSSSRTRVGRIQAKTSGDNAGIGGNNGEAAGCISIYGGRVESKVEIIDAASAVGGGNGGSGGTINIYGGYVGASGNGRGAAIGGGSGAPGGQINIYGGEVNAVNQSTDVDGGAAIGGGNGGDGGNISILGGYVNAQVMGNSYDGSGAAAIGGGYFGNGGTINIVAGEIYASNHIGSQEMGSSTIGGGLYGDGLTQINISADLRTSQIRSVGSGWKGGPCALTMGNASNPLVWNLFSIYAPGESTIEIIGSIKSVNWMEIYCDGIMTMHTGTLMLGDVNNAKIKIDGTLILENNCTITRCADTEKEFLDGIIQGNGSVKVKSNATVGGAIDVSGNVDIQGGTVTRNIYSDGTVSLTDARLGNWVTRGNHNLGASVVDIDGESLVFGNVSGNIVTIDDGDFFGEVHGGTVTVNYARFAGEGMVGVNGDIVTVENCLLIGNTECSVSGTNVTLNGGTVTSVWGDSITINADAVITENIFLGSDDLAKKTITINGGVVGELSLSSNCEGTICSGKISSVFLSGKLNIYGGSIGEVTGSGGLLYDYCGTALQENVKPINIVYLNCVDTKNVKGQVRGSCILQNQFIIEDGWEVQILPGATFSVSNLVNHGVYLIAGIAEGKITGNSPYYAINADSETVASVSAGDSIVRDGVTFVPEGKVVTLKSKGTGAMHWAVQPAYLNVTNNKFYMPDEVVSVKASALPLEATPTIQVDGEKLTGFTAGEYYSISDAIFRPTGTTLPIRPEWYGATVSIVKLGDGFATGDSFAQALAIPSQSSGTVTPPNPGGGTGSKPDPDDPEEIVIPDGDWEEAEEELSQADSGDTVIVETDEDDTLPDEVLESAAGKNVTLKIKVGDSIFWEIDCRVIPKDASLQDIFLQVSMNTQGIPSKVLCGLPGSHTFLQMTLGHDGLFGFPVKLHADVGRGNSGKWANLYYYNEGTGKMEFETAARITASGDAVFTMTHASQYAIVLDEKSHTLSFQDVGEGAWFQGAVEYVYRAGLMAGTGDTTFEPNAKLTRAMTAQILYNLEGQPEVTGETTFSDMNTAPDWSMDAIAWAQDTGVVAGMGDNTFAPNLKVTREQFAQMLYNYAKYKKCDLTKAGDLTKFPDEGSVSDWAVTALSWANGNGLINGHENGTLDPQGNTVRGQAASILMNFDLNVVKSVA